MVERAAGLGSRTLKPGIYAPIPTFFLPGSEDLGKNHHRRN